MCQQTKKAGLLKDLGNSAPNQNFCTVMCQGEGLNLPHCENDAKQSKQETSPHSLAMTTPEVMLEVPDMMLLEKY